MTAPTEDLTGPAVADHMIKDHRFSGGQYRIVCTCGKRFSNPAPGNAYVAYRDHAVAAREADETVESD